MGTLLGEFRKNNIIPIVDVEGYVNWLTELGEERGVPGKEDKRKKEKEEEDGEGPKDGGCDDGINLSMKNVSPAAITTAAAASEPHGPPTNLLSSATTTEASPPPPYPQSFSHLVELITTGQLIPGIKEVPNILLTGQGSRALESKRKKPWEVHREEEMETRGGGGGGIEENGGGCDSGDIVLRRKGEMDVG